MNLARLSAHLRALGVANRLDLLSKLQLPRTLSEIQLQPTRRDASRSPERALSRRAVEGHVEKLQELGLVRARSSARGGRPVTEYLVNRGALFLLVDEFRRLSLAPGVPVPQAMAETTASDSALTPGARRALGPALVLVGGPIEGTAFPLSGEGPWVVGREKGVAVSLPYDPFVSKHNSRVWREEGRFFVQSLPGARNGTRLNWGLLRGEERSEVAPGDVLGVGRSLLVFQGRDG